MNIQDEGGPPPPDKQSSPNAPIYKAYQPPRDNTSQQYDQSQQRNKMYANNGHPQDIPSSNEHSQLGPKRKDSHPGHRDRSRTRTNRKGSGQIRICKKCGEPLTGQFVRALDGTFHLDCFKCAVSPPISILLHLVTNNTTQDCGEIVASKFFPVGQEGVGEGQFPLCETDYFRRLDLLCHQCGGALRGSYITALDRKYHIDHFTCSVCPTVFSATDSYYEHEGQVYCHYHYSTQFAQKCNGCQTAILKQFVEIFRNGQNQHWHPECYMIHKFWNVRLADSSTQQADLALSDASDEDARNVVRDKEEKMEDKVYRIWSVLSVFEESSAANISDMLLHVSNGAYVDGVMTAKKFIWHVDLLFKSADKLDVIMKGSQISGKCLKILSPDDILIASGLDYPREAKLLCKKIVAFFALLSKTQGSGVRKLGVTQELLSLVTGLAHYLKLLIRICLQGALRAEREANNTNALDIFLEDLRGIEAIKDDEKSLLDDANTATLADPMSDQCPRCRRAVDSECARVDDTRWHIACLSCENCSRSFAGGNLDEARWDAKDGRIICINCKEHSSGSLTPVVRVSRLEQYVYLLKVALARLLDMLRRSGTLPHTSDNPNLNGYDSQEGHRVDNSGAHPAILRSDSRSKSYGGNADENPAQSSYERTLNDVRRLRSTRMDKHLSSTIKKARSSRIIDQPQGQSVRPGSAGPDESRAGTNQLHIVEDVDNQGEQKNELFFGHQDALTLDDIPRIVAAEQAKEQRPNAYKHARHELFRTSITEPKLINGHQRSLSNANELEMLGPNEAGANRVQGKKFFSELSALEYFIVRHVAVLSMQPLLEGHFTLEELLGLIESRKPTFWGKFGKAFQPKGPKKSGVFGVPLERIIEKEYADSTEGIGPNSLRIPVIVDECIKAMRQMDLSVEGVFRKNGSIKRLNEDVAAIDKDGVEAVDLTKENVVQVAALLKRYLRELPDPLLTFKLHRLYLASQKIADEDKRRRVLHLTCCLLPKAHRDCLEILCTFLNFAASFHQVDEESGSKMDTHNLATVIAPNILFSKSKDPGMDESFLAIEAVHSLIEFNEQMCEVSSLFSLSHAIY